jgi:hypothetical protein
MDDDTVDFDAADYPSFATVARMSSCQKAGNRLAMSRRQAVRRYQAVSKQAPHSVSRDTFGNRMRAFHQPCLVLTFQPTTNWPVDSDSYGSHSATND